MKGKQKMRKKNYQIGVFATLGTLMLVPNVAYAESVWDKEKWDVSIGGGAMYSPKYEGSDNMEVEAMPYLDIEWNDRVFLPYYKSLVVKHSS